MSTLLSMPPLKPSQATVEHRRWVQVSDLTGRLPCKESNQSYNVQTLTRSRSGWSWDDWKTRLAKKQDASTNYSVSFLKASVITPGMWKNHALGAFSDCGFGNVQGRYRVVGTAYASGNPGPSTNVNDAYQASLADAMVRKEYYKRRPDFNAVVPVGEWRETGRLYDQLVNDTFAYANKAYNLLNYAKTPKQWKRLLARSADYWLAYSFGIAPLVTDLRTAAMDLASKTEKGPGSPSTRISRAVEKTWDTTSTNENWWADTKGVLVGKGITRSHHSCEYRTTMGFDFQSPLTSNLDIARSVFVPSFREVVVGLYDLIPWSFLLDYVSTTGDWLESQFQLDTKPIYGSKSILYVCNSQSTFIPNSGWSTLIPQRWETEYVYYQRVPDLTLASRKLEFKPLHDVLSAKRLVNVLSLGILANQRKSARANGDFVRNNRGLII